MNIKKMFTTLSAMVVAVTMTLPSVSVFWADYSQELQDAYNWAYSKSITTMSPIENANMYGKITRAELAKMLANWAKDAGKKPDTSRTCNFSDTASVGWDLGVAIVEACQLGLMGQGITAFRPYDTITRAEFGTALSRALWGEANNGGTPYYAKHLNALKTAGIMTQIENAESRLEVRGYVMLMLMRSESYMPSEKADNCDDPLVQVLCATDEDKCPAECRDNKVDDEEGDETDNKVKSGSLVVEADAASDRSAIKGAASDLDTLTFKTSEEVEITKVVLERYGYSSPEDIDAVWLENSDGTVVAEEKSVNSKDTATLSIKKDYRKVDGTEDWTIVVRLKDAATVKGSTIGFKVTDVTSTAKDVDLGNYKPFLYDIVTYDAVKISLDDKGSDKDYNYEEGDSYEVAKLKVKAGSSALEVNGFNLTNLYQGNKLDLKDFVSDVDVQVAGKSIKWVSYKIDDDELNISFDSYEIAAKWNVTFTVFVTLKDFDEYGDGIEFVVKKSSDAKIIEKKTWARVDVVLPHGDLTDNAAIAAKWTDAHAFIGSKIKFSGKKLGNVDAAQASDDIVILDWEVEVAEAIDRWTFTVTAQYSSGALTDKFIEEMRLTINGDEYSAKDGAIKACANFSGCQDFTFENVEIEESGKLQVLIDVEDDAPQGTIISFKPGSINKNMFDETTVRYTEARSNVKQSEVKGSVSFASKVTVQPSKASLVNDLTKRVEFTTNDSTKKTVFEGTYTAKKGKVLLNTAIIAWYTGEIAKDTTFYLYIDGDEVATLDPNKEETFTDVEVEANKSVKVKVEAEISTDNTSKTVLNYSLVLRGDDENGNNNAWEATKKLVDIKVVEKGTFNISTTSSKDTVLLKARNVSIAKFTIKPSNNNEGLSLEDIILTGWYTGSDNAFHKFTEEDIRLEIDGVEYTADDAENASGILYYINEELPSAGWTAEVFLENEIDGDAVLEVAYLNGLKQTKKFEKSFALGLVYIDSQQNQESFTEYFLGIDLYDDAYTVKQVHFYTGINNDWTCDTATELDTDGLAEEEVSDQDNFSINNVKWAQTIKCIAYKVVTEDDTIPYQFNNKKYADYFKVNGSAWRVWSND